MEIPAKPEVRQRLEFIVDSGATYSVVPSRILRRLKIKPLTRESFRLANGTSIVRRKGAAIFKYQKWIGGSDGVFGEGSGAPPLRAPTPPAPRPLLHPIPPGPQTHALIPLAPPGEDPPVPSPS